MKGERGGGKAERKDVMCGSVFSLCHWTNTTARALVCTNKQTNKTLILVFHIVGGNNCQTLLTVFEGQKLEDAVKNADGHSQTQ